jgi:hypothetical protein
MFDPVAFHLFSGLTLPADTGLLSEARGAGAVVVGFGLVILAGAIVSRLREVSLLVAAVLFYAYAAGRLTGLALDGMPPGKVMQGLVSEIVMGTIAVVILVFVRRLASELTPE